MTTLVAGAVGVSYYDKSVNLSVDGKASAVHAFGTTVGDVLAKQDIKVGEHDVVVPSAGSKIEDGQKIVVRYGRKLSVTVDGKTRDYWTTATTVAAALQELGIRADSAKLSASRSQTLGREGLALSVTTPKALTVHVDGKNLTGSSTSPTVKDALTELKVKVDRDDRVKPALNAPLTSGMQIAIQRVTAKTVRATQAISFSTVKKSDSSIYKGESKTVTTGKAGAKIVTYRIVTVDGKTESKRPVATVVTAQPVNQVVAVGTKSRPAAPTTPPVSGGNKPSADGLNWAALAQCESGGNPATNTGNGFYGLYQFDEQTWHSIGGSGLPSDNSAGEQTYRAQLLYKSRGDSPWPVCGAKLYT